MKSFSGQLEENRTIVANRAIGSPLTRHSLSIHNNRPSNRSSRMSLPLTIDGYEPEWALLSEQLTRESRVTWPIGNVALSKTMRFRFYGFRKALKKHSPDNPWISALMETQALVDSGGNLIFSRNPYSELLKSLLEGVKAPAAPVEPPLEPLTTSSQDAVIERLFSGKKS